MDLQLQEMGWTDVLWQAVVNRVTRSQIPKRGVCWVDDYRIFKNTSVSCS